MQTIIVTGRLGHDAKIYTSTNGNNFIAFSIASNTRIKKNEENTYWWDVVVPNHLLERYKNMVGYLTKGSAVIVQGELDPEIQYDNNGKPRLRLTISAVSIQFNSIGNQNTNGQLNTNSVNDQQEVSNSVTANNITIPTSKPQQTPKPDVDDCEELPF